VKEVRGFSDWILRLNHLNKGLAGDQEDLREEEIRVKEPDLKDLTFVSFLTVHEGVLKERTGHGEVSMGIYPTA
jgi:hypothetical protein